MRRSFSVMMAAGLLLVAVIVTWKAEIPSRLETAPEATSSQETTAIQLPAESPRPEPPKPEAQPVPADDIAALAPESFQTQQLTEAGFGASYGSGGGGPALGGRGGFGSEGDQLVSQSAQQDRLPKVISRGVLEYPPEAKTKGIQGYVIVKIQVGPSGAAEDIRIAESQPAGFFDQAVLKSVRSWRFEPGLVAGQVASAWISQKVRFELD